MKKIILLTIIVLTTFSYIGCSNNRDLGISGEFQFEKVVYLSPLSSSTIDYEEKQMEGTIYKINRDNFEIVSSVNQYKISDPIYEKIKMDNVLVQTFNYAVFNSVDISKYKEKYQYIIYTSENQKANFYLYSMDDELWIAAYADNTANKTDIIMNIYKIQ